jgi:methylthioribose-1-phosphate isomerase
MSEPRTVSAPSVETMRFGESALELIDQRVLPAQFRYLRYDSAEGVADAIRSMVVRGAPAIGCAAAFGVALEALRLKNEPEFEAKLDAGVETLAASRPTAVNLFWALERMQRVRRAEHSRSNAALAERLVSEARAIFDEDIANNRRLGAFGAALLPDEATVLTHCNAGALATAGHGTALGIIRSAIQAKKRISVLVDETRPFMQGARLTAWELTQEAIPTTLITDNMAGYMMQQGGVAAVIVGTDRVAANGDVANKIGTYMVAVLARHHGIPFYVACPTSTIDLATAIGDDIAIEERAPSEVTDIGGHRFAPLGVNVRNPAFDVTPAELVSALVTELGVLERPNRENLARFLASHGR